MPKKETMLDANQKLNNNKIINSRKSRTKVYNSAVQNILHNDDNYKKNCNIRYNNNIQNKNMRKY